MEDDDVVIRLAVHVAENGKYFELNCPVSASVQILQTCIASIVGVTPLNQLLLCDSTRLDPQRTLAFYRLPPEGRNVFLFNRPRLLPGAPPPEPENVHVKERDMPSLPLHSPVGFREGPPQDTENALPYFQGQFQYHLEKGRAVFSSIHEKFDLCRQLLREQQVQHTALVAAKGNVNHFYNMIEHIYGDFVKSFSRQHKHHSVILTNFERDMNQLGKCRLHPRLISSSGSRRTLLDCVDAASLRNQVELCAMSHTQFEEKVAQLKALYYDLTRNVQELFDSKEPVDTGRLEQLVSENASSVEEQHTILQSLSKDVDTVKKLAENYTSSHPSGSFQACDAISALGPMYDVHDKDQLPRMEGCHRKIGKLLDLFRSKKNDMNLCVHTCMQNVANLQSSIRDMRNHILALKEALIHQDGLFSDLKLVNRVGPAYRACLAEVVRRKASMKLYMGLAGQLAERMAKKRAVEISVRDEFMCLQSAVIPQDLLCSMGLFESPNPCIVNIEPYDTNLLDIDIQDLEEYAPIATFGPHYQRYDCQPSDAEGTEVEGELEVVENDDNDEISGTSNLEVENARLKAELAGAIALLCNINTNFVPQYSNNADELKEMDPETLAMKKTIEALALKDKHAKHLESMLAASQLQSVSYEKRIRELEQRLSDNYTKFCTLQGESKDVQYMTSKSEISGVTAETRTQGTTAASELMEEEFSSSSVLYTTNTVVNYDKGHGVTNESMANLLSGLSTQKDWFTPVQTQDTPAVLEKESSNIAACTATKNEALPSLTEAILLKENQFTAIENRLEVILGERDHLKDDLESKIKILNQCYMNCAELESNLLQAREEARTNKCWADRKAAEYSSLRASSVKLRGLVERLRHYVFTSTDLVESLQAFANSLNSMDDVTQEFGKCVKVLAEKVSHLVQKQNRLAEGVNLRHIEL